MTSILDNVKKDNLFLLLYLLTVPVLFAGHNTTDSSGPQTDVCNIRTFYTVVLQSIFWLSMLILKFQ
jgi:hypothetical protein